MVLWQVCGNEGIIVGDADTKDRMGDEMMCRAIVQEVGSGAEVQCDITVKQWIIPNRRIAQAMGHKSANSIADATSKCQVRT